MSIKEIIADLISSKEKKINSVNVQESYNLWEGLRTRYDVIEEIQIYESFIHDLDFELITQSILSNIFEEQINKLETKLNKYKISLPNRPPKSVRTTVNTEVLSDRLIAIKVLEIIQVDLDLHIRSIRTSTTNESVRKLFKKFLNDTISLYDKVIKYLKTKGWMGIPPQYPNLPKGTNEQIDSGEVFHLFDHLTARYDAVGITQIFHNQTDDSDFKYILKKGLQSTLENQINTLEKEMNYFGIPLPMRPAKSVKAKINSEPIEDELIFREVFTSISNMLNLHANGFKQNVTNDRIRNMYINFLKKEVKLYNQLVKYGKLKGWSRPIPMYKVGKSGD
ncbi:hypothetical protein JCM16358_10660 [Halanaerocella petrolearia]